MKYRMGACLILSLAAGSGARAATDAQCNQMLNNALESKNPDTRKLAVAAMSLAATRGQEFERLEGMLRDKDVEVRLTVVASLAEVKSESAISALRTALDDDVPEVSFAAAKALWGLHDSAGEQALLAVLGRQNKTSSNFFTKQKRDAMRMIHTPRVLFLYAVRQGVGFAPVPGLGEGITSMQALLTDPGVSGRAAAALLLGKDTSPAALDALEDALADKDWSVRAAAVHSLALRNDPKLRPDLQPLLGDEKEPVRLRAAAAMLRMSALEEQASKAEKPPKQSKKHK